MDRKRERDLGLIKPARFGIAETSAAPKGRGVSRGWLAELRAIDFDAQDVSVLTQSVLDTGYGTSGEVNELAVWKLAEAETAAELPKEDQTQ